MTRKAFILYAVIVSVVEELVLVAALLFVLPAVGVRLPLWAVIGVVVVMGAVSVVLTHLNLKAIVLRPKQSPDVGGRGRVVKVLDPHGYVRIGNELWPAVCESCVVHTGSSVAVVRMDGLRLVVEPVDDET